MIDENIRGTKQMTKLEQILVDLTWVSVSDYFTTVSNKGSGFILYPKGDALRLLAISEDNITDYRLSDDPLELWWDQGAALPVLFDIPTSDEFIASVLLSVYPENQSTRNVP